MFAVMITAQVFFFAKSSVDSVSEERELLMYRMNLDSLVEEAKDALLINGGIVHWNKLDDTGGALKYSEFYDGAKAKTAGARDWELSTKSQWENAYGDTYSLMIHDLDYSFDADGFNRNDWTTEGYGTSSMYKKPFSPMLPRGLPLTYTVTVTSSDGSSYDVEKVSTDKIGKPVLSTVYNRFFLIRAWAKLPENYYGMRLMYQVLVSRDEPPARVDTLSFQEVWF